MNDEEILSELQAMRRETKDKLETLQRALQYEIQYIGHQIEGEAFWSTFINTLSFVALLFILWRVW